MLIYEHVKHGFHIIQPGDNVAEMEKVGWLKSTHPSERKHETGNPGIPESPESPESPVSSQIPAKARRGRPAKIKE